jgi:hypothetical protein
LETDTATEDLAAICCSFSSLPALVVWAVRMAEDQASSHLNPGEADVSSRATDVLLE